MRVTVHASTNGEQTLCGRYCGFHNPLAYARPVEGWPQRVNCQNCRHTLRFREIVAELEAERRQDLAELEAEHERDLEWIG